MRFKKTDLAAFIFLLLASIFSVKALAIPNFYTSHDGETHTARLANYYLAMAEGQWPPQLAPTLFGGFGFPIFIFIYPLPYLIGSLLHHIGLSYTDSAELTMAIGQVLSAVTMFLFLRVETKKTMPALIGALFFIWAPYRFSMIFVRGAFAESFAYIFVGLSLLCLNRILETPKKYWIGLAGLSIGGLLLSHQLVSVMFLPVLTFYVITKLIDHKARLKAMSHLLVALILGFCISAFIYAPAFMERHYLRFDDLISYYKEHFVTVKQLIRSPWSYGFSHPGIENDDMSFQIGLTHLVVVFISFFVIGLGILRQKIVPFFSKPVNRNLGLWLLVFFAACFVMIQSPYALWSWANIPGLSIVDFPWRFLGVATMASVMLVSYLLLKTNSNIFLVVFLLFFVFYANRNHLRINETVIKDDNYFNFYPATATWRNEFLPHTRMSNKWQGIEGDYQFRNGEGTFIVSTALTHKIELQADIAKPGELLIHRMFFPGWIVTLDGKQLEMGMAGARVIATDYAIADGIDYSGFMLINLEAGKHNISAHFQTTPLRYYSRIVSLLGILVAGILILEEAVKSKKSK